MRRILAGAVAVFVLGVAGCGPAPQQSGPAPAAERPREEARRDETRKQERREERKERRAEQREAGGGGSGISGGSYDLERDEERGGHTLRKHVGRTDEELRERLAAEPNISAASTWTSRELAEETVGAALRDNAGRIAQWFSRGARRANLALHYDAGHEVGRSLMRGAAESVACSRAVIVLKADGGGSFLVLTTYPEASR